MTDVVNTPILLMTVTFSNSAGTDFFDIYREADPIFGLTDMYLMIPGESVTFNHLHEYNELDGLISSAYVKSEVAHWNVGSLFFLGENYIFHTTHDNKPFEIWIYGSQTFLDSDYLFIGRIYRHSSDGAVTVENLNPDYTFVLVPRGDDNFGHLPLVVTEAAGMLLAIFPTGSGSPLLRMVNIEYRLTDKYGLYVYFKNVTITQEKILVMTEAYTTVLNVDNKCIIADTQQIFDGTPYLSNIYDMRLKYEEIIIPTSVTPLYGGGKTLVAFYSTYPFVDTLPLDYLNFSLLEADYFLYPGMPPIDDSTQIYWNYISYLYGIYNSMVSIYFSDPFDTTNTFIMIFIKSTSAGWVRFKCNQLSDITPPFDILFEDDSPVPRSSIANIAVVITTTVDIKHSLEVYYQDGNVGIGNNYIYAHTMLG
jgi:hypothetical protein